MPVKLIHLSDLHLRQNWPEAQGVVLSEFFADLKTQITDFDSSYIVFTGDLLQEGSDPNGYQFFGDAFGAKLNEIGFSSRNLIFVPGNHDVDRNYTSEKFSVLKALQEREVGEKTFNDTIYGQNKELILGKFKPFLNWQNTASKFALDEKTFCGQGFSLSESVGIYCLNTALYSFGGLKDEQGTTVSDLTSLPVETRNLHKWIQSSNHELRILALHHPFDWLSEWACNELQSVASRGFDLVLSGHVHEQKALNAYNGLDNISLVGAPALFTSKSQLLGYSIIDLRPEEAKVEIFYRQWTGSNFVRGVAFAKNDEGKVVLCSRASPSLEDNKAQIDANNERIENTLKNAFEATLKCYSTLPSIWVTPNISFAAEFDTETREATIITADDIVSNCRDMIIKAPPQFGLSSLGRYIAYKAWQRRPGQYVMFIDSSDLPNHESGIRDYIQRRIVEIGIDLSQLHAIVLDEGGEINRRKINNLKKEFEHTNLVVLLKLSEHELVRSNGNESNEEQALNFEFVSYYLWSLDRMQMRELVEKFTNAGYHLRDEEAALQRLVDDIENLNLHRTPMACLTLLAVYSHQMEYSPTNRTDMFERFLFLVFYAYKKNPDYSNFPDMKDALFVMGAFCENLIRQGSGKFRKKDFISGTTKFCEKMSIDVDCAQLFEVIYSENIIVRVGEDFLFRYVHWVYFFGAHRMHQDKDFCDYILSDSQYMNYPEIIEFYSGIDRRRERLLSVLIADLKAVNGTFEDRTSISDEFDPYSAAEWVESSDTIKELRSHLRKEAEQSQLPNAIKDEIADANYDRKKPYSQEIKRFVNDSSLRQLMQIISAACRALRNSDYVDAELKSELLTEIMRAWKKELQVLFLLSPVLAKDRLARFDNVLFFLSSGYDKHEGEDLWQVLVNAIPSVVVSRYEKDIGSPRMTPLLKTLIDTKISSPEQFIIAGILIRTRPSKWADVIGSYIRRQPKNSFYLLKTFQMLIGEYKYGFVSKVDREKIYDLAATTIARHETGSKTINQKLLEKAKKGLAEQGISD